MRQGPQRRLGAIGVAVLAAALVLSACASAAPTPTPAGRLTPLALAATPTQTYTPIVSTPAALTSPTATATARPAASATPTPPPPEPRLSIPEITLVAEIVEVPIVDGTWDVDDLGECIGHLDGTGDSPGDSYAPVLAAHVANGFGTAGPVGYLWSLSLGGTIILDWGDTRYTYEVIDRRKAQPSDVAKILIPDGNQLVLLTCEGWDLTRLAWDERLLVIAELVETAPRP